MVDIPSLEQNIKVQQGLTTQWSIYPRLNGSIGTHDSKVDVPSLEQNISVQQGLTARWPMYPRLNRAPFTIIFLFSLGLMDQQCTSSRDGLILLIYYSVYKTIQNSNKIFNTHHINSNNMFIVQPICSLTHTYTQTSRSSYLEPSTHCFPFPYEFLLNTSLTSSPIIVSYIKNVNNNPLCLIVNVALGSQ